MRISKTKDYYISVFKLPDGWRMTRKIAEGCYLTLYRLASEPKLVDGKLIIEIEY